MADSSRYEALFNRLLDVTTCVHMPLKLFTIYVIVLHTPPQLRHYSYFTLNTMFWNFLANFALSFMHLYPLFPAVCFRADGISRYFIVNENIGQMLTILHPFLVTECAFALMFSFPHRYIVFVHPKLAARIRPAWVFALCSVIHVIFGLFYFPLIHELLYSSKNYPNITELSDKEFVFCLHSDGMQSVAIVSAYAAVITVGILIIVIPSVLFMRKVRKLQEAITHDATLALQKKVFASLLGLTAVAMLFGGIPLIGIVCGILFPTAPFSRETALVSIVIVANHGTISAIVFLAFFKAYRNAVNRIFSNLIEKLTGRKTRVVIGLRDSNISVSLSNTK